MTQSSGAPTTAAKEELVYDLDTGETVSRTEYNKRKLEKEKAELAGIDEDEEDEEEAANGKGGASSSTKQTK